MPKKMTWDDADGRASCFRSSILELIHWPCAFLDLHRLVTELPQFKDESQESNQGHWKRSRWHGTGIFSTALKPRS